MDAQVRRVEVPAERLSGWIERFALRHGGLIGGTAGLVLEAVDGARADLTPPFTPDPDVDLIVDVLRARTVGAVLVRRGGFAVGVFDGTTLLASKVDRNYVQGKTKAGGWSQQRYARRRANQAQQAYADAAEEVLRVLGPRVDDLDAVVGGGDRAGVEAVLADPRLSAVRARWTGAVHPTPDPRLTVLQGFPEQFRAVTITLNHLA